MNITGNLWIDDDIWKMVHSMFQAKINEEINKYELIDYNYKTNCCWIINSKFHFIKSYCYPNSILMKLKHVHLFEKINTSDLFFTFKCIGCGNTIQRSRKRTDRNYQKRNFLLTTDNYTKYNGRLLPR